MDELISKSVRKLGYLFYITTPNQTVFENLEDIPDYVNEVVPLFVVFILLEFAVILYKKKIWSISDSITSVSQGILHEISKILTGGITLVVYLYIYENWRLIDLPWNSAPIWWFCLVAVDFGYYWFHRASHEIHIMWAAHQVHHSSEEYNLTTALRQSVLQNYFGWIFYLPLAFAVPPPIYVVHLQLNLIYQFWIHTELIKSLGPLEYIFNTPSHHRVHHGRNRYCIDKNYAGVFILWDRIFGTFEAESDEVAYGLVHPICTFDPVKIQLGHIHYLLNAFWESEGLKNKLSVLFKGPGWQPGKPWHGDPDDIPEVSKSTAKYNPALMLWCNCYILFHFVLILIGYVILSETQMNYSYLSVLVYILYIVYTLTTFGAIMDKKSYAAFLELVRCLAYFALDKYLISSECSFVVASFLQACFLLSFVLWSVVFFQTILLKVHIKTK